MATSLVAASRPPSCYGKFLRPLIRFAFRYILGNADTPLNRVRGRLDFIGALSPRLPGLARRPVTIGAIKAEWLTAEQACDSGPVILYLHGGGYVSGSIKSHRELAGRLALVARARCLIIDYRLAPEHPHPAALEDSLAAWHYLIKQGVRPEQIVIAGDSAGGGLALATGLALRERGAAQLAAIYCMSPWTDVCLSGDSLASRRSQELVLANPDILKTAAKAYCGGQNPQTPLISPLFGSLEGLPPLLIQVGSDEVLLDDALRFHSRAQAVGVNSQLRIWSGMWHVWPLFYRLGLPEARQALADAAGFINQHCGQGIPEAVAKVTEANQ